MCNCSSSINAFRMLPCNGILRFENKITFSSRVILPHAYTWPASVTATEILLEAEMDRVLSCGRPNTDMGVL